MGGHLVLITLAGLCGALAVVWFMATDFFVDRVPTISRGTTPSVMFELHPPRRRLVRRARQVEIARRAIRVSHDTIHRPLDLPKRRLIRGSIEAPEPIIEPDERRLGFLVRAEDPG